LKNNRGNNWDRGLLVFFEAFGVRGLQATEVVPPTLFQIDIQGTGCQWGLEFFCGCISVTLSKHFGHLWGIKRGIIHLSHPRNSILVALRRSVLHSFFEIVVFNGPPVIIPPLETLSMNNSPLSSNVRKIHADKTIKNDHLIF